MLLNSNHSPLIYDYVICKFSPNNDKRSKKFNGFTGYTLSNGGQPRVDKCKLKLSLDL